MSAPNPFADIEARLAEPSADGMFLLKIAEKGAHMEAGLRQGDIVVAVGGEPVTSHQSWMQAMQPQGEEDSGVRKLEVARGAERIGAEVPAGLRGLGVCWVKEGHPAWIAREDTDYEPDFSWFEKTPGIWLRNTLGEERAGYERLLMTCRGEYFDLDIAFALGGDAGEGKTWDYRTQSDSAHNYDRYLSVRRTEFHEAGKLVGRVALGEDNVWRGVRGSPEGEKEIEVPFLAPAITPYTSTLLPLTMPLADGACLNFVLAGDGSAVAAGRSRIECLGRRKTTVDGEEIEAWCFAWRHYGSRKDEEDEHYFVSDDRRLMRIDWGPNYGNCWCELVPEERVLEGVPEHVTLP